MKYVSLFKIVLFYLGIMPIGLFGQSVIDWEPSSKRWRAELGTEGLGLGFDIKTNNEYRLHARLTTIGYKKPFQQTLDNDTYVDIQPKFARWVLGLGVSHTIWKPWIELEGGLGILLHQKCNLHIESDTGIDYEGLQIQAKDFGPIDFEIRWSLFQVYSRVYLGKPQPQKKINFRAFGGMMYMGRPSLAVRYSGFLETTNLDTDIKTIEHNMRNYSFYPVIGLQIHLNK